MRLGRNFPDLDAELFFAPDDWRVAYILNKRPLPSQPPRLYDVVRLIGQLGGF
jgi:hypothetical protein